MIKKNKKNKEITKTREVFFDILAEFWKEYDLPGLCGYIDALMWLERREDWTQTIISQRLKELFGKESKYPTSITSINRAIKINVEYGTVVKKGNHKMGYTYHVAEDIAMLINVFQNFIEKNNRILTKLKDLQSSNLEKNDIDLYQAIQVQIYGIEIYNDSLEHSFNFLKEKVKGLYE